MKKTEDIDTGKEQERAELHRAIWQIANDLRGSVDGWDFKQYVLGILFYRFISENLVNHLNDARSEGINFDYAEIDDKTAEFGRKETVIEKAVINSNGQFKIVNIIPGTADNIKIMCYPNDPLDTFQFVPMEFYLNSVIANSVNENNLVLKVQRTKK